MAQHNYDIANQAGSLFRADLNNVLSAIQTNNLGTSDPDTSYTRVGGMWWLDTTDSWLKLRNSTNTQWIKVLRYSNGAPILSPVQSKAGTYTVLETELGNIFRCTAALTLNLPAVSGLYDGWWIGVRNESGGSVTLDGNASEQINGATTFVLQSGVDALVYCNGSAFYTIDSSHANSATTATTATTAGNVTGTVAVGNGGTGQTSKTPAFDALAPSTTKGDLIAYNGSDNVRVAVGTNGYVLAANSGASAGVNWVSNVPAASSVDAGALNTTTEEDSITSSGTRELSYSGGFLFYPRQKEDSTVGVGGYSYRLWLNNDLSANDTYFHCYHATYDGFGTQFMNFTYVQASPPYSFGQGDVPLFVYVVLDSLGKILNIKSSQDPPWINDRVKPDFYENGKGYKRVKDVPLDKSKLADPSQRQQHLDAWRNSAVQNVEVTREFKNTYMAERPRPGIKPHDQNEVPIPIATHGLVHPVGPIALDLREMMDEGESPGELIHNYMEIDNVPVQGVNGPPGVPILNVRWKNNP